MFSRVAKSALSVSLTAIALFAGAAALAETVQTIQTLDRVDVYNKTKVLEMEFDDPGRAFDFTALGIAPTAGSTGFSACQVTASQALYCIDGKDVVVWPKPAEATGSGTKLFSCADAGLGFDGQPCTGLTVDDAGTIWVAGRKAAGAPAASAYAITRVTPNVAGCAKPLPSAAGAAAPYCALEYATGPRGFVGLSPIDGEVGAAFVPGPGNQAGPGVLGLEVSLNPAGGPGIIADAIFFPRAPGTPISIGKGATQWSLAAGEQLQSVTMLQLAIDPNTGSVVPRGTANAVIRSFILAATGEFGSTAGRILAIDTQNPDLGDPTKTVAFQVFDIAAERATASTTFPLATCSSLPQQYGLRASSKSGRAYLTDRTFCQAAALEAAVATGKPFALRNVQEEPGTDLTFSTTEAYPPDANTIAAGIVVNLGTCGANCVMLSYKDGTPAASLSNVKLVGSKSGMSLFQVKGIPDCRYINPKPAACLRPDVIVNPADPANKQFLNVTPLLPVEITALFNSSGIPPKGLPRMLISPQYRAQNEQGFLFEALFGITDDGVVFQGTFDLLFDVGKLIGNPDEKLGCGYDYSEAKKPNLDWDVITTVSERVITAGGPGSLAPPTAGNPDNRYVDMLVNTGCINPTKGSGDRWSMYAYNLEITPNKDDVFAQLLLKLFDDLDKTRAELACKQVDTTGAAPLSTKVCSALKTQWSATKIKLDKCYKASIQPKSSAGSENCQAFFTQLKGYQTILNGASTSGPDPANRLGELKARVNVLFHVYSDRFLPSIPANGFKLL